MVRAYSSCAVGRQTPNRPLRAGVVRATLGVPDIQHPVYSMLLAVHRFLFALAIEVRPFVAKTIRATLAANVHHAVLSMLRAARRRLAAFEVAG